jgi:hypothetical protein
MVGNAFQLMLASISEGETGPGHKVLHRLKRGPSTAQLSRPQHRPQRPVLLAVDQELGEGDRPGSLDVASVTKRPPGAESASGVPWAESPDQGQKPCLPPGPRRSSQAGAVERLGRWAGESYRYRTRSAKPRIKQAVRGYRVDLESPGPGGEVNALAHSALRRTRCPPTARPNLGTRHESVHHSIGVPRRLTRTRGRRTTGLSVRRTLEEEEAAAARSRPDEPAGMTLPTRFSRVHHGESNAMPNRMSRRPKGLRRNDRG